VKRGPYAAKPIDPALISVEVAARFDALEPGHTLSAVEAGELGAAFAALIAGALGVAAYQRLKARRDDDANDDGGPEAEELDE